MRGKRSLCMLDALSLAVKFDAILLFIFVVCEIGQVSIYIEY